MVDPRFAIVPEILGRSRCSRFGVNESWLGLKKSLELQASSKRANI